MPIIRKVNAQDKAVQEEDVLKDNDEVFYCEMSNEIFRNYEDYFDRVMFLNSTVWTCALTSRPNLTYAEALESERNARRVLREFPFELQAPLVVVASFTQRSGISDLVDDVFNYVATRFFNEETVSLADKKTASGKEIWRDYEILAVMAPGEGDDNDGEPLPADAVVDPALVRYRVRRIPDEETAKLPDPLVVRGAQLRRPRSILPKEKLKLFLKQCVECNELGVLKVKPSAMRKFVTDGGVRHFGDCWPGRVPTFETSKWLQQKKMKAEQQTAGSPKTGGGGEPKSGSKPSKENLKPSTTAGGGSKSKDARKSLSKAGAAGAAASPNQPAISNYFAKNDGKNDVKSSSAAAAATKKPPKPSKDELLRQRREREEAEAAAKRAQLEERERAKVEQQRQVAAAQRQLNRVADDAELPDQRPLPRPRPVRTLLPDALLPDALFVLEFLYSFAAQLECTDKFPRGFSLALMERALLCPEVDGPFSDALQVLLGTVFSLQMDEAAEVHVAFADADALEMAAAPNTEQALVERAVREATAATAYTQRWLAVQALGQLPMDANTVSELLRLHLLQSGAREDDELAKWRFNQRGGYANADDPGLALRVRQPHIVRHLAERTVYELAREDQLAVLVCLANQICTYATIRDKIDERFETAHRARINLRSLVAAERRREETLRKDRAALLARQRQAAADAVPARQLAELDDQLRKLDRLAEKAAREHAAQSLALRQEIFSYQLQLGADRAQRTYWLFESLPGLFVARPNGRLGECAAQPVRNNERLAQLTSDVDRNKYIKQLVVEAMGRGSDGSVDAIMAAGERIDAPPMNGNAATAAEDKKPAASPSDVVALEMMMCTGAAKSCPVHGAANDALADADGVYAFLHTEAELDALIGGLNVRGAREKQLREQLELNRDLIVAHLRDCDVRRLQVRDEADRERGLKELLALPDYQQRANMGFPAQTSVADVTEGTLVDNIAELERRVTEGHLGRVAVASLDAWRRALTLAADDGQSGELRWGPEAAFSRENRIYGPTKPTAAAKRAPSSASGDGDDTDAATSAANTSAVSDIVYADPGQSLAADTADDSAAATATDATLRERVYHIARSLLQVAQAIEPQFFRPPFGATPQLKDAAALARARADGQAALRLWQVSLMNATSHAQVFLHYALLEDSIVWSRSTLNAVCSVCRRRHTADKMLLCDGCNAGRHTFCCKPKLARVPEGDWFCEKCRPPPSKASAAGAKKRTICRHRFGGSESGDDDDLSSGDEQRAEAEEEPVAIDMAAIYRHFDQDTDDLHLCMHCDEEVKHSKRTPRQTCEVCLRHAHPACQEASAGGGGGGAASRKSAAAAVRPWMCGECKHMGRKQRKQLKRERGNEMMAVLAQRRAELAGDYVDDEDDDEEEKEEEEDAEQDNGDTRSSDGAGAESRAPKKRVSTKRPKSNGTSDDVDDDDAAPKRPRSSRTTAGKKRRRSDEYLDDDDGEEDDDDDFIGSSKPFGGRRSNKATKAKRKRSNDYEEDDDTLDDDDDDIDDEADDTDYDSGVHKPAAKRRGAAAGATASRRRSATAPSAAKKSKRSISSRRQPRTSTVTNGRTTGRRATSSDIRSDDDDGDGDGADDADSADSDDRPLNARRRRSSVTTGGAAAAAAAASRRTSRRDANAAADAVDSVDTVACYALLQAVAKHPHAWPFERPVNRHEVPDYHLVIERPMDLAKVKSRLNMGEYRTNGELMRDVQQIFVNCDLYNTSGSEIYNSGLALEQFVQARCGELHLPFQPSDMLQLEQKHLNGGADGGGGSSSKAASSERSDSGSAGKVTLKLKLGGGRKVRA